MPVIPVGRVKAQENQAPLHNKTMFDNDIFAKIALQQIVDVPGENMSDPMDKTPEADNAAGNPVQDAMNSSNSQALNKNVTDVANPQQEAQNASPALDPTANWPKTHKIIFQALFTKLDELGLLSSGFIPNVKAFDIKPDGIRIEVVNNPAMNKVSPKNNRGA